MIPKFVIITLFLIMLLSFPTVLYVGDINLATLALKEYDIIKEDDTIEGGSPLFR